MLSYLPSVARFPVRMNGHQFVLLSFSLPTIDCLEKDTFNVAWNVLSTFSLYLLIERASPEGTANRFDCYVFVMNYAIARILLRVTVRKYAGTWST